MAKILFASSNLRDYYTNGAAKLSYSVVRLDTETTHDTESPPKKAKIENYHEVILEKRALRDIFGSLRLTIQEYQQFFVDITNADCVFVDSKELHFLYRSCLPDQKEVHNIPHIFQRIPELEYIYPPTGDTLKSHTMATSQKLAEMASERPWCIFMEALKYEHKERCMVMLMENAGLETDTNSNGSEWDHDCHLHHAEESDSD
jgi:hypothetical protein